MSQSTLLQRRAIKLNERQYGATITWAGAEYPVASGPETRSKTVDLDGMALVADLLVAIRRELLPSLPQPQQTASYRRAPGADSKSYRIQSAMFSPGDAFVQLALIDPNRGA